MLTAVVENVTLRVMNPMGLYLDRVKVTFLGRPYEFNADPGFLERGQEVPVKAFSWTDGYPDQLSLIRNN